MSEVIVFTSGKGGVGKSNLCLNTALELTAQQYRTCLFDGDLGLANVNILLGIEQEYTLDDVVFKNRTLDEILVQTGYGFDIIPGSSGVEQIADLSTEQLEYLIAALSGVGAYDFFLIDTASGISRSVISFCLAARQTVIVITREATSLTDAYALLKILSIKGYQGSVRILINNCDNIPQAKKTYLRYKKVVDKHLDIAIAPAGIVLHDDHFEEAVRQQKPLLDLYPDSIGAQCIRAFVANLIRGGNQQGGPETLADFWQRYLELVRDVAPGTGRTDRPRQASEHHETVPDGVADGERQAVPPVYSEALEAIPAGGDSGLDSAGFATTLFTGGLCSSPVLLGALFSRFSRGECSVSTCRELLASDPVLLSQLLYLFTPGNGGFQPHIHRLDDLFDQLDDERLQALLVQAAMKSLQRRDTSNGQAYLERWLHGYSCGILARELAYATSFAYPEEAYICGLLHDIGHFLGQASGQPADASDNHARVGADYLQSFGLNNMMCDAVRFHHHSLAQVGTGFDLVRIVFCANVLINGGAGDQEVDEAVIKLINLPRDQAIMLPGQARAEALRTAERFGFDAAPELSGKHRETQLDSGDAGEGLGRHLMEHLLTAGVMPPITMLTSLADWTRRIHFSCGLLFNLKRTICFLADQGGTHLTAIGFPGCFSYENLGKVVIEVDNTTSLVSRAFTEGRLITGDFSAGEDGFSLGDYQLGRLLGAQAVVCIPLKAAGTSAGLIVCGTSAGELGLIEKRGSHLAEFGNRAARDLAVISRQGST